MASSADSLVMAIGELLNNFIALNSDNVSTEGLDDLLCLFSKGKNSFFVIRDRFSLLRCPYTHAAFKLRHHCCIDIHGNLHHNVAILMKEFQFTQLHTLLRSLEAFVDAVSAINAGSAAPSDFDHDLASVATTYRTTAILEAGRRSLDEHKTIQIVYDDTVHPCRPTGMQAVV